MEVTVLLTLKEAGGTNLAIMQILTGCTMADHTILMQMELAGMLSEGFNIH